MPRPAALPSSSSTWCRSEPLPWRNHDLAAAVLDGWVYIAGGLAKLGTEPHPGTAFASLLGREPASGRWSSVASLREPRVYAATAAFAGEVWVLGGDEVAASRGRRPVTDVTSFVPGRRPGTVRPPLPRPLPVPVAGMAGGYLCVLGCPPGADRLVVFARTTVDGPWRELAAGPRATAPIAGTSDGERLYVAVPGEPLWTYSPAEGGRWVSAGGPLLPRSPQLAARDGEVWILGGRDAGDGTGTGMLDTRSGRWRSGPRLPEPLAWGAAAVVGDELLVIGGAWDDTTAPDGWRYSDRTWRLELARGLT